MVKLEVPDVGLKDPVHLQVGCVQGKVDGPARFKLTMDVILKGTKAVNPRENGHKGHREVRGSLTWHGQTISGDLQIQT